MSSLSSTVIFFLALATLATVSSAAINEAGRFNPRVNNCANGGTMRNGKCDCPPKWTGPKCEEELCQNGGRPFTQLGNEVVCSCPFGLGGQRCEKLTKCDNGRLVNGKCECERGFVGLFCQSRPCHQGIPVLLPGQNEYTCVCDIGYTGHFCQEKFECLNGGRINAQNKCECRGGHTGELCENKLECVNGNFSNHHNDCICINGFSGESCTECEHIVKNGKCAPEASEMSPTALLEWTTIALFGGALMVLILVACAVYFVLRRWCSKPSRVSSQPSRISTTKATNIPTAANMAPVPTEV